MKICICSSLTFADEVNEVAKMLEHMGYEVLLSDGIVNRTAEKPGYNPVQEKIDADALHKHTDKIRSADAVLVCNFLKNCTPGYIGASCFAEIFMARYFDKPVYALFTLPESPDEVHALGIEVINNDLSKLPEPSWWQPKEEPALVEDSSASAAPKALEMPEKAISDAPKAPIAPATDVSAFMPPEAPDPVIVPEGQPTLPFPPEALAANDVAPLPEAPEVIVPPVAHSVFSSPADLGIEDKKPLKESAKEIIGKIGGGIKKFANFCSGKKTEGAKETK